MELSPCAGRLIDMAKILVPYTKGGAPRLVTQVVTQCYQKVLVEENSANWKLDLSYRAIKQSVTLAK